MSAIEEPLILPADVMIVPVAELAAEVREQIDHADGDCSITRPRTRTTSSVIDAKTAALLGQFRTPVTIVDAVIAYSAAEGLDPRATLEDAFAVLGGFVSEGLLVAPDSELAQPIDTAVAPGDTLGGFEIVAPLQVILDTEVHLARTPDGESVALKLAREGSQDQVRGMFIHEAAMLALLDGLVTPKLLDHGAIDGRPFVAMSWCAGVDVHVAAAEARALGGREGRVVLLALAESVLSSYAHLHAQEVLHGDVHPRNVLIDGDDQVRIIDFGLATHVSEPALSALGRGGIDFFMEPEVARASLLGSYTPALSASGEQYSVAALLYLLLTGTHTHTFSLEPSEMLRQLLDEPPRTFSHHGVDDLPEVAAALTRALAKQPSQRYPSLADMHLAFSDAAAADLRGMSSTTRTPRASDAARRLLSEVLGRLAVPDGELFAKELDAPSASAQNGAAGFAYALLRIAGIRGDEALLGDADVWSAWALHESSRSDAFYNEELEIVPEKFGERSFHHMLPGVHAVAALVAGARCDERSQHDALEAFVTDAGGPCEQVDVAFGRAGLLLGCALLLESLPGWLADDRLRSLGGKLSDSLIAQIAAQPRIEASVEPRSLGAAHGWAGVLFALLRWCEVSTGKPAPVIAERLPELAALGQPLGRGMLWPHDAGSAARENPIASGWCNGAAGYVALWTLAHRLTGEDVYARFAQGAAWCAYEDGASTGDLCCGLAGRAYALLSLYRHGGDGVWLARAHELSNRAAVSIGHFSQRRNSLYKGDVGVALLAADLEDPLHSCMPLFEGEGWSARA